MNPETPIVLNAIEPVLRTQRKGALLTDLSAAMQQAVAASREHLKESVITLTLRISPLSGDGHALSVRDEVTLKLPQARKPNTLFYATDDNCLVREDPHQQDLPITLHASNPDRSPATATQTSA
jgi:hypothetical protein